MNQIIHTPVEDTEEKDYSKLNIYQKLQKIRIACSKLELKKDQVAKSGDKGFGGYNYFSFPEIQKIVTNTCDEYNVLAILDLGNDGAELRVVNTDKVDEYIVFKHKFPNIIDRAPTHSKMLQNLGSKTTYMSRYMYIQAFSLCENDPTEQISVDEQKAEAKELKKITKLKEDIKAILVSQGVKDIRAYINERWADLNEKGDFQGIYNNLTKSADVF